MKSCIARPLALFRRALDERAGLRHGLFWLLATGLVIELFLHGFTTSARQATRDALLLLLLHVPATYALLGWVLPALGPPLRRGPQRGRLAAWLLLSLAGMVAFRWVVFVPLHQGPQTFHDYYVAVTLGPYILLLGTAGVAACLHLYRRHGQQTLANAGLAQATRQAELALLQAQLHPHFLFNTLNTLYALTLRQAADQAAEVVERLSGLLRFVVEQSQAPTITLAEEITLLRDYLALEQRRYGPRLTLELVADDLPPAARLAPLLLLPLVENAFKHGAAEQLGPARVRIELAVADGWLRCLIANTTGGAAPAAPAAPPGIGLPNVRERLRLLYPHGQHRFEVVAGADCFTVRLALRLADPRPAGAPVLPAPAAWPLQPVALAVPAYP